MPIKPQPDSRLLALPSEIRNQIWHIVFSDEHVVASGPAGPQLERDDCCACSDTCGDGTVEASTRDYPSFLEVIRPLSTCKQIRSEAKNILFSTMTLHLGLPMGKPMTPIMPQLIQLSPYLRRLEWSIHIMEENRFDWVAGIPIVGSIFPKLEEVIIHAHVRPPDSYEKLMDAIYLALPIVRLKHQSPHIRLSLNMGYITSGVMFESPFLGEITTEDALDEHELVVKDLIADAEFIQLALMPEADMQSVIAVVLRCAREHEQSWFEKLQRKRLAKLREMEEAEQRLANEQNEQAEHVEHAGPS